MLRFGTLIYDKKVPLTTDQKDFGQAVVRILYPANKPGPPSVSLLTEQHPRIE